MVNRLLIPLNGRSVLNKAPVFLGITFLTFLLMLSTGACGKTEESPEEEGMALKEGIIEFEGTVKVAVGRYVFVPEARGFDIIVQGSFEGGTEGLVDKEVKIVGEYNPERPSILIANSIEVKDSAGTWMNIFTRTEDVSFPNWISQQERDDVFLALEDLAYDKREGWEGKEKAKVFGQLEQNENQMAIIVLGDNEREVGRILVDNIDDYADFYIKKLRLFEKFWFYLDIKETVDWSTRRRTRELFHADVLFAGLY